MANSGFTTRKLELDYDKQLVSMVEMLAYKVMDLVKNNMIEVPTVPTPKQESRNGAATVTDESIRRLQTWSFRFFERLRKLHQIEKSRYADPKFVPVLKPLAKYLHKRHAPKPVETTDYSMADMTS